MLVCVVEECSGAAAGRVGFLLNVRLHAVPKSFADC